MRTHYMIMEQDVDKPHIIAFGKTWPVSNFIGRIQPQDVGKWVFRQGDYLQVENQEQFEARTQKEV